MPQSPEKIQQGEDRTVANAFGPFENRGCCPVGISDNKCVPASDIKPEIKAQNIRATDMENACP